MEEFGTDYAVDGILDMRRIEHVVDQYSWGRLGSDIGNSACLKKFRIDDDGYFSEFGSRIAALAPFFKNIPTFECLYIDGSDMDECVHIQRADIYSL